MILERIIMSKLNNIIVCLVGKSGCGKSTVAKTLSDNYGYDILQSYTTRKKRNETDVDHIFISKEEYDALDDKVAYTCFDNNYYCATKQQVDMNDLYIIDLYGLKQLKQLYKECNGKKKIISIYIDVPMEECLRRMRYRGDSEDSCWDRLRHDDNNFKCAKGECDYCINGISNGCWYDVQCIIEKEMNT